MYCSDCAAWGPAVIHFRYHFRPNVRATFGSTFCRPVPVYSQITCWIFWVAGHHGTVCCRRLSSRLLVYIGRSWPSSVQQSTHMSTDAIVFSLPSYIPAWLTGRHKSVDEILIRETVYRGSIPAANQAVLHGQVTTDKERGKDFRFVIRKLTCRSL